MISTLKEARKHTGTLTSASKMPCKGTAIPIKYCITGAMLAEIEGTTCSQCYLKGGNFGYPNVIEAMENRYQLIYDPKWVEAMAFQINYYDEGYFRHFVGGDLQSIDHLSNICEVCFLTPSTKHWLPTQELALVLRFIDQGGIIPENLIIRASGTKIDGKPSKRWKYTSSVVTSGQTCPAPNQGGKCLDCRACWTEPHTSYLFHK